MHYLNSLKEQVDLGVSPRDERYDGTRTIRGTDGLLSIKGVLRRPNRLWNSAFTCSSEPLGLKHAMMITLLLHMYQDVDPFSSSSLS